MATIDTTLSYIVQTPTTLQRAGGSVAFVRGQLVADPGQITELFNAGVSLLPVYNGMTTPTIAAGAAAGTSPTVAISGSGAAHKVTVTTGTSPATGVLATVTLPKALGVTPIISIDPGNAAAAALTGATAVWALASNGSSYVINAGSSALAASTAYAWQILVSE